MPRNRLIISMAVIPVAVLGQEAPALAQEFSIPPINPGIIASVTRSDPLGMHFNDLDRADDGRQSRSSPSSATAATSLRYVPSLQRREVNLARFVAKSRAADHQGAAAMEQLFAGTDVFAAMSKALAPAGLRIDDVADAYAVWWMSAWGAAHGDASTPSRAKAQAVRAQAARALAATSELARADDAAKQEFAEALLVQTALIDGMVEQYGRDPAMAPKIAASVRQGAKASGVDLDAMTLTETGFVPAR